MNCRNCGKQLPPESTARRAFCDDLCRVQHNRAAKAQDTLFDAMVAIRKLSKGGKIAELKQLRESIDDLIKNNS